MIRLSLRCFAGFKSTYDLQVTALQAAALVLFSERSGEHSSLQPFRLHRAIMKCSRVKSGSPSPT